MDPIGFLIIAVAIVAVIAVVARRSRGDRPGDRGPYSTAMEARGGLAAFGTTIEEQPEAAPPEPAESDED